MSNYSIENQNSLILAMQNGHMEIAKNTIT